VATSPVRIIAVNRHHMRALSDRLSAVAAQLRKAAAERGG
jgi:hypothetical protein